MPPSGKTGPVPRIIRPLGHLERWVETHYSLKHFQGTAVSCRYAIPPSIKAASSTDLSLVKERFTLAVARTILSHPLLQVGIIDTSQRVAKFVELDDIDLDWHILWHEWDREDYDERLQKQMTTQLDTAFEDEATRPGWRLNVSCSGGQDWLDANFLWRHTMCDGMSAKIFHQDVLRHLNAGDSPTDLPLTGSVLNLEGGPCVYPPPIDKMAKFISPKKWLVKVFWKETRPDHLISKKDRQVRAAWAPYISVGDPVTTVRRTLIVGHQTTAGLIAQCRNHDTTISGLIIALALTSAARQLPEEKAPGFITNTALDLRRFMPKSMDPHNTVANIVASRDFALPAQVMRPVRQAISSSGKDDEIESQVWVLAGLIRSDLQKRLDTGLSKEPVGILKLVRDWREEFTTQKGRMRKIFMCMSNLGVLDGGPPLAAGDEKGWRIVRGDFMMAGESCGPVVNLGVMSVKGEDMVLELTWQKGSGGDEVGDVIAEDLDAWLRKLGGSGAKA